MFVTLLSLNCALSAGWWSCGHFLYTELVKFYLNNVASLHPLTPHICQVITTKWLTYRDHRFCDVNSPYVFRSQWILIVGLCLSILQRFFPTTTSIFGTFRILCAEQSLCICWASVRLSAVCPRMVPQQQARWCKFAVVGPVGRTYRLIAARRTAE